MSEALRLVSRERLRDAQRWHLPAVEPRTAAGNEALRPSAAELDAITAEARERGFAQGLAEGRRDARTELEHARGELHALCTSLARPLADVDTAVEQQLAELAMLVARRVIEAELRLQPAQLLGVVRKAIDTLPGATAQIEIRVHPQSAALLRDGLDAARDNGWHIAEDASLKPGDCRISSADSRIDARVATRLAALVDAALDDGFAPPPDVPDDAAATPESTAGDAS